MREKFEEVEIELIEFENVDVITGSSGENDGPTASIF